MRCVRRQSLLAKREVRKAKRNSGMRQRSLVQPNPDVRAKEIAMAIVLPARQVAIAPMLL